MYALGQPSPSPHSSPMERTLFIFWLWGSSIPKATYRKFAIEEIGRVGLEAKAVLPQIIEGIEYAWDQKFDRVRGKLDPDRGESRPRSSTGDSSSRPDARRSQTRVLRRREVVETLGKIGPQAIGPLLNVAQSGNLLARRRALEALGRIGPPARGLVPMFVKLLANSPAVIRITAAQALGNIGPDAAAAIPVLKTLLSDRDILLRKRVGEALSRIECRATTV